MLHILTLTWNAVDKLTKLKESLMPCLEGIEYTWWIKDNASNDNTIAVASTWGDNVRVIPHKNNLQNFSQGMNLLFHQANPKDNDFVLLLNNDVIFGDTVSLSKMIDIMKDQTVGVVGAKLLYTNTNKLQHAGVVFHPTAKMPMHFRSNEVADENSDKDRVFQVVTGAVLLTKGSYYRKAFTNANGIQGMDESYHWAFDDVDLCLSIGKNLKKKIIYCGKTNIFHEESASLKKNPANQLFMKHNKNYFLKKWADKCEIDLATYSTNNRYNLYKQG